MDNSKDPLLQPFQLKHLELRNRIISTSHEPAYSEDALPKLRYQLYHEEKAKGGIAMTMFAALRWLTVILRLLSAIFMLDPTKLFRTSSNCRTECIARVPH